MLSCCFLSEGALLPPTESYVYLMHIGRKVKRYTEYCEFISKDKSTLFKKQQAKPYLTENISQSPINPSTARHHTVSRILH